MSDDSSPNLGLPLLVEGEARREDTFNQSLMVVDTLAQLGVYSRTVNDPPAAPPEGARWIVGPVPTGAWAGKTGWIAAWIGGWKLIQPKIGWYAYVRDQSSLFHYDQDTSGVFDWVEGQAGAVPALADLVDVAPGLADAVAGFILTKLEDGKWGARPIPVPALADLPDVDLSVAQEGDRLAMGADGKVVPVKSDLGSLSDVDDAVSQTRAVGDVIKWLGEVWGPGPQDIPKIGDLADFAGGSAPTPNAVVSWDADGLRAYWRPDPVVRETTDLLDWDPTAIPEDDDIPVFNKTLEKWQAKPISALVGPGGGGGGGSGPVLVPPSAADFTTFSAWGTSPAPVDLGLPSPGVFISPEGSPSQQLRGLWMPCPPAPYALEVGLATGIEFVPSVGMGPGWRRSSTGRTTHADSICIPQGYDQVRAGRRLLVINWSDDNTVSDVPYERLVEQIADLRYLLIDDGFTRSIRVARVGSETEMKTIYSAPSDAFLGGVPDLIGIAASCVITFAGSPFDVNRGLIKHWRYR